MMQAPDEKWLPYCKGTYILNTLDLFNFRWVLQN